MRLGGWSHTGGTYVNAMMEVNALCKAMFGYELPEKIGAVSMKDYRYRPTAGLAKVGEAVNKFQERKLKE
jgi:hypothetical protein